MVKNIIIFSLICFLAASVFFNYDLSADLKKADLDKLELQKKLENQPILEKIIINHEALKCNQ